MHELKLSGDDFSALAGELILQGKAMRFTAQGGSMRPQIQSGDLLEVQPVEPEQVHIGDVLMVALEGKTLLVHRVVRISRAEGTRRFLVQGDAVRCADGWAAPGEVIGRVASLERAGRLIRLDSLWRRLNGAGLVYLLKGYKYLCYRRS